ncbi:MAG TPA: di-heme oxidoredictase family protein, partial [Blastocatellia bacterium]|nr:di-heme oxidoredictase family protein [Blastocatellia bacterium]
AQAGQRRFEQIGCGLCHVSTIVTAPAGTAINGGTFTVPEALGDKIIHPYSDFLLHDVGTGDGIVQGGPQDTAHKLRTAPLWGLRMRPRYMHDLTSLSLPSAIARHSGEADDVRDRFVHLSDDQKQELFTFLNSL